MLLDDARKVRNLLNIIYDTGHISSKIYPNQILKKGGTSECDQHRTICLMSHIAKKNAIKSDYPELR